MNGERAMFSFFSTKLRVLGLSLIALGAQISVCHAAIDRASSAALGVETSVPFGWVDFCQRRPEECQERDSVDAEINLTPEVMRKIARINTDVNTTIAPITDMDQWGLIDFWDFPSNGKGDCEDYALLKRQRLIQAGFPGGALLLTVVKQRNGEGHSILTIKTNRGDYVLDNLNDQVKPWNATDYRYVKRQSQADPNVWVAIEPQSSIMLYAIN